MAAKTVSRFPPIKTKTDDTPNFKENMKEVSPPPQFVKKISEEPTVSMKRTNGLMRKKVDKKKAKFP